MFPRLPSWSPNSAFKTLSLCSWNYIFFWGVLWVDELAAHLSGFGYDFRLTLVPLITSVGWTSDLPPLHSSPPHSVSSPAPELTVWFWSFQLLLVWKGYQNEWVSKCINEWMSKFLHRHPGPSSYAVVLRYALLQLPSFQAQSPWSSPFSKIISAFFSLPPNFPPLWGGWDGKRVQA